MGLAAGVAGCLIYSLVRVLVDLIAVRRSDHAQLQAEVLVLRRQVQVLERQIRRVRWSPIFRCRNASVALKELQDPSR